MNFRKLDSKNVIVLLVVLILSTSVGILVQNQKIEEKPGSITPALPTLQSKSLEEVDHQSLESKEAKVIPVDHKNEKVHKTEELKEVKFNFPNSLRVGRRADTVINGDWTVTGSESRQNEIITLNGNLIIQSGGSLTLSNVTLFMNCSISGEYRIEVNNGGSLTIEANSTVTALNTTYAWFLKANSGSSFVFTFSTFSYAGFEDGPNWIHTGIWINTPNGRIINCTFNNNRHGIFLYQAQSCLIANNTFFDNLYDGLNIYDTCSYTTIVNNIFSNNGNYGIYLGLYSSHAIISGNTFDHNFGGIDSKVSCLNTTISNNSFSYNPFSILISQFENGTISGNNISFGTSVAIYLTTRSHNNTVTGNYITNSGFGFLLKESRDNVISNNTVVNSLNDGISLNFLGSKTSDDCIVTNNIISKNSGHGISVYSHNSTIFNNTIANNDDCGILLEGSDNNVSNNNISNNFNEGIKVGYNNNFIFNNTVYNNTDYGIYLASSSHSVIWNTFIDNNGSGVQAYSAVSGNTISYNHWNDLTTPDTSPTDGIVDTPYTIDGAGGSIDPFPLSYPAQRYIIIDSDLTVTDILTFQNKIIILDANLLIQLGGDLILSNVTLFLNCSSNGQYRIEVYNGGRLEISGYSTLTASNPSYTWYLKANSGCTIVLRKSIFRYAGYTGGSNGVFSGLWINTGNGNITNCTIHNNYVGLFLYQANGFQVTENLIFNSTEDGIQLDESGNNIISDNTLFNNSYQGLLVKSSSHNIILNNTIYNNSFLGIVLDSSSENNTIRNNTVFSNDYDGIGILYSNNNTISRNTIRSNFDQGVYLSHSNKIIITENIIQYNTNEGIYLSFSENNNLSNNVVKNNIKRGIVLRYSNNNNILNNNVCNNSYNNYYSAIYLFSSINNTVASNNIQNNSYRGIYLSAGCEGNVISYNIIKHNSYSAIGLSESNNNVISNNTIYNNTHGIGVSSSNNNTVSGNIICIGTQGGIGMSSACNNTIFNNTISNYPVGITLSSVSKNNIVFNNTIYNSFYGIILSSARDNTISDNRVHNNNDTGIYLYSSSNNNTISNNTIYKNGEEGIYLSSSTNNTISGNIISNNTHRGIYLELCSENMVYNNSIFGNLDDGIELEDSNNNTINKNRLIGNKMTGIMVQGSLFNNITLNHIENSTDYGIYLTNTAANNAIHHNDFIDNGGTSSQAYDDGSLNKWYSINNQGNWWSDFGGFGPYSIDGSANSVDLFPLNPDTFDPVVTIISPLNTTYGINSIPLIFEILENNFGTSEVTLNGIPILWLNNTTQSLSTGTHTIVVNHTDSFSNSGWDSIVFTIDSVDPIIIITSPSNITYGTNSIILTFTLVEDNPGTTEVTLDGSPILWPNNTVQSLSTGTHTIVVTHTDALSNTGSDSVVFTIDESIPAINVVSPINTTYGTNPIILTFTLVEDNLGTTEVTLDGSPILWLNNTVQSLSTGTHTIVVTHTDTLGNIGSDSIVFTVDKENPIVTIISPANTSYSSNTITLNFTIIEDYPGTTSVTLDNLPISWSNNTLQTLSLGTHTIRVEHIDINGNSGSDSITFTLDSTVPSSNNPADQKVSINQVNVEIPWIISDAISDSGTYSVYRNDSRIITTQTWSNETALDISVDTSTEGLWNYTIYFWDETGNSGKEDSVVITVSDPPVISPVSDFTIYFGEPARTIVWLISDDNPATYVVYHNTAIHQAGTFATEIAINLGLLSEGQHNFTVVASDLYGSNATSQVWVNVVPATTTTTPPTSSTEASSTTIIPTTEPPSTITSTTESTSTTTDSSLSKTTTKTTSITTIESGTNAPGITFAVLALMAGLFIGRQSRKYKK